MTAAPPTQRLVRVARPSDQAAITTMITLAFGSDPFARWCFPKPQPYLTHTPEIVKAFGGKAFDHKSAYCLGDFSGAALWLPPGVSPDEEALISLFQRSVAEENQAALFAVFEQMGSYHPRLSFLCFGQPSSG
jgi:hypothetical protein